MSLLPGHAYSGVLLGASCVAIAASGRLDDYAPAASEIPVADLPSEMLPFLLGSRYCETDKLSQFAWNLFGSSRRGWHRVQTVVDYVHNRLRFDYQQANAPRSAAEANMQQVGVCRDFAHLAITFCRCLNIPARYATGYLGDIGVPPDPAPMDFSAWFEVYLNGPEGPRWYTFDGAAQSLPYRTHCDGAATRCDGLRPKHDFRHSPARRIQGPY